jgi:integrase
MKAPKFTHGFVDRHGTARFYFRKAGCKQVPLPGLPWSPVFMAAYQEALTGVKAQAELGAKRIKPGSIDALVLGYFHSITFGELAAETKRTRRNILERFAEEHGDKRAGKLQREHITAIFSKKRDKRFAARNWLKTIRALMQFAVADGRLKEDPTTGIKNLSSKTEGFRSWTEDDIAKFVRRWPVGTRERLALELLVCTAQRRSDIVRMGRQHIRMTKDGPAIDVVQQKTGNKLAIPIHPDLQAALDAVPSNHLTFLTTLYGRPFSAPGFTNWFRATCNQAGIPRGTSAHGLRKAACRRLAEAGCSANVIASISGHRSLNEVERYTRAADQARMARDGMATLVEQTRKRTEVANPGDRVANSANYFSEIKERK